MHIEPSLTVRGWWQDCLHAPGVNYWDPSTNLTLHNIPISWLFFHFPVFCFLSKTLVGNLFKKKKTLVTFVLYCFNGHWLSASNFGEWVSLIKSANEISGRAVMCNMNIDSPEISVSDALPYKMCCSWCVLYVHLFSCYLEYICFLICSSMSYCTII